MGMKHLLLMIGLVALVGCGQKEAAEAKAVAEVKAAAEAEEQSAIIEKAIREELEKPEGELTKVDLEKVTSLGLGSSQLTDVSSLSGLTQLVGLGLQKNKLTDVSALAGLTKLRLLGLEDNPSLAKAEIEKLQKALPECRILSNSTK